MQTHMTNLRKFENENKIESTCVRERVFGHTTWNMFMCIRQHKYHKNDEPMKMSAKKIQAQLN